jgi:hypothetical protein
MPKKPSFIYEEPGKLRYDKFIFNLKKFWNTYNAIAETDLTDTTIEQYKTDYVGIVAAYASCAVSFDLPIAWSTEEEKELKQLIEKEMGTVRPAAKVMNTRIEQLVREKELCQ